MENVGVKFSQDALEIAAPDFLAGDDFIDTMHAVHVWKKSDEPTRVPRVTSV